MANRFLPALFAACFVGLCACTPPPASQDAASAAPTASTEHASAPAIPVAAEPAKTPADASTMAEEATPAAAEAVVRAYYAAINARDFATAHAQWGDDGAASGQSLENFRNGYANTISVEARVGTATAEEGAAGSRFILVPVELQSSQQDGSERHYRGFFVLRAVVADGASTEQRRWHLHSAEIERLPDQSSKR